MLQVHLSRTGNTDSPLTVTYSTTGTSTRPATGADFVGGELPGGSLSFAAGERSKALPLPLAPGAVPGHTLAISIMGAGVRPSSGPLAWVSTSNGWRCEAEIVQFDIVRPDGADHPARHDYVIRDGTEWPGSAASPSPDGVLSFSKGQASTTLKCLFSGPAPRLYVFEAPPVNALAWSEGPVIPRKTTKVTATITPPTNIGGTGFQARVTIEGHSENPVIAADFWNGKFPVDQMIWIPSRARSSREFLAEFSLDATPGRAFEVVIEGIPSGYTLTDTTFAWTRDAESGDWSTVATIPS